MIRSSLLLARRHPGLLGLLLLLSMMFAPMARAASPTCSANSLALTIPAATVPSGAAVGTTFGSPQTGTVTFTCSGLPNGYSRFAAQMYGLTASQFTTGQLPSGTGITSVIYTTNVTGVGVQLTMNPGMSSYDVTPGDQQSGAYIAGYVNGSSGSLAISYTAQLIVTGTVSAGTISSITFGKYEWYIYGYNISQTLSKSLTLNSGTVISLPTCTVNSASQNLTVTLPSVSTSAFTGVGSTAGTTAFSIGLSCPNGANNVSVTLTGTNPSSTANGVLLPTSGGAGGVGVQVLNQSGTAITWGTAISFGKAAAGNVTLPFFARYYQTTSPVSAGKVSGTATFTMSYQ
ncbi:fimbrial protein [Dyella sp. C9]|uniref:fimbrial protein n=1 Tax=Dyella sp. C9 TaxID=2202154 RepID=UPI000DEEBDBA|nr:fimbrial protein [Dyella sp. C9]